MIPRLPGAEPQDNKPQNEQSSFAPKIEPPSPANGISQEPSLLQPATLKTEMPKPIPANQVGGAIPKDIIEPDERAAAMVRADDVAAEYQVAQSARDDNAAMQWLMKRGQATGAVAPPQPRAPKDGNATIAEHRASRAGFGAAAMAVPEVLSRASPVLSDIATGITTDASNVWLGGPMLAIKNSLGLIDHAATWLNTNVLDTRFDQSEAPATGQGIISAEAVPNVVGVMDKPKSVTGNILQGMTQFITGFATGGRMMGMGQAATTAGLAGQTMIKGSFADFTAFKGADPNLANLIQMVPSLQNPVTAYLAHEGQDDSELEKRMQNVLAGAIPNVVFEGFLGGLRAMRAQRKVAGLVGEVGDTSEDIARKIARSVKESPDVKPGGTDGAGKSIEDLLGKIEGPDVEVKLKPPPIPARTEAEIAKNIDVSNTGIPDHVTAKWMYEQAVKGDPRPGMPPIPRTKPQYVYAGPPDGPPPIPIDRIKLDSAEFIGTHLDDTTQELLLMAAVARRDIFQETFDRGAIKSAPQFFGKAAVDDAKFTKLIEAYRVSNLKLQRKLGKQQAEQFQKIVDDAMNSRPTAEDRLRGTAVRPSYEKMKVFVRRVFSDPSAPLERPGAAPRDYAFDPQPKPTGPKSEVYVNWSRIETSDDIKRMMAQMVDADPDAIAAAQRGVRSNAVTAKASEGEDAWKLLVGERKEGAAKILNAEEQFALRKMWTAAGDKLVETAKAAREGGAEEIYAFRRMMATYDLIQKEVVGVRTETARALQQWRMPAGSSPKILEDIDNAIIRSGGSDLNREIADKIISAAEIGGAEAVSQFVKASWRVKTADALREVWINAILSGPKTHLVNMISNSAVLAHSMTERAVAARVGSVFNPIDGVRIGEATAMMQGLRQSYKDAFRLAAKAWRTGQSGFGMQQIDAPRMSTISAEGMGVSADGAMGKALDALGAVVNAPGRALGTADEFFKTINYRAELWAAAFRHASEEIDRGILGAGRLKERMAELITNPPDEMMTRAREFAKYNTFTNDPGEFTKAIMKIRSTVDHKSIQALGIPSASFVVPFINTPANLFSYAFERTPVAAIMGRFKSDIAAGGARANMAMTKLGLGTMMMTVAYDLAMDGHITGSGPTGDWSKMRHMRANGWQPHSVRIQVGTLPDGNPEYRWFAGNRLDPLWTVVGLASEIAEYSRNHNDGVDVHASEAFAASVFAIAENLTGKAMLRGFSDFVGAVHDSKNKSEYFMNRLAGSFVPTGVKEWATISDPRAKHVTNLSDAIKARLPGYSKEVPARLNYWGKPIEYSSGLGSTYDALSPIYSSSNAKAEPIDREFFKVNYFPRHPGSVRVDGRSVTLRNLPEAKNRLIELTASASAKKLADENLDDLVQAKGGKSVMIKLMEFGDRSLKQTLNDLVGGRLGRHSIDYQQTDDNEKWREISQIITLYRRAATLQVLREFPRIKEIRASMPERKDSAEEAPF